MSCFGGGEVRARAKKKKFPKRAEIFEIGVVPNLVDRTPKKCTSTITIELHHNCIKSFQIRQC